MIPGMLTLKSSGKDATMADRDRAYLQTPEQWTRFLSSLVHELRTPLASLRMLADLLTQSGLGDPEKRYADSVQEVVQDVQFLVGDVAELAQLLAGRALVRSTETALEPLISQVQEAVRPRAWERGIALTDSLDPALPRHLHTDPDRLRRALVLVLGAAVSHAESEVFFRLDFDGENLRAVVSSNGAPFQEADLPVLFEPFHDGLRTSRQRGGRSLALPLADELARVLGGTLRASNRGGRPTFDLTLPAGGSP